MQILGVDFGGSGIKGPVDDTGAMLALDYSTPDGAKPRLVAEAVADITRHFS
jgi:hypothetical protein